MAAWAITSPGMRDRARSLVEAESSPYGRVSTRHRRRRGVYGLLEGYLKAVDEKDGTELFKFKTPSGIIGNVMAMPQRQAAHRGAVGPSPAGPGSVSLRADGSTEGLGAVGGYAGIRDSTASAADAVPCSTLTSNWLVSYVLLGSGGGFCASSSRLRQKPRRSSETSAFGGYREGIWRCTSVCGGRRFRAESSSPRRLTEKETDGKWEMADGSRHTTSPAMARSIGIRSRVTVVIIRIATSVTVRTARARPTRRLVEPVKSMSYSDFLAIVAAAGGESPRQARATCRRSAITAMSDATSMTFTSI